MLSANVVIHLPYTELFKCLLYMYTAVILNIKIRLVGNSDKKVHFR